MKFWQKQRILVTGGYGFLGNSVMGHLLNTNAHVWAPGRDYDLRKTGDVEEALRYGPTTIIHLAAFCGGIQKNIDNPADMIYNNLKMGMELIEAVKGTNIKVVMAGSACEYPKHAPVPLKEENLWDGYPEETNGPYGIAKRTLEAVGRAYRAQYGTNIIHLLLANLYGPGDNFGYGSHFIPAMIKKFVAAKKENLPEVTFWGTGEATRDLLYVSDAAEGILLATEHYNSPIPVNVATGREHKVREVAYKIAVLTGYNGLIKWDGVTSDGQPRRVLDVTKASKEFGFEADTLLEAGLARTIEWYGAISR